MSATLRRNGFTLVETLVAVALLGLVASAALWTLTQTNKYSALSRFYTGARIAAQGQIDLVMSKGPFNPQKSEWPLLNPDHPASDPDVYLKPGIYAETVTVYAEPYPYREVSPIPQPSPMPLTVTGQRVTTVTDTGLSVSGRSLNLYAATVVVTFYYPPSPAGVTPPPRTKHQVQLNTLRASDADGS
jgi:prepilin-type N-terminal cleavage/methylation domain-containing protein